MHRHDPVLLLLPLLPLLLLLLLLLPSSSFASACALRFYCPPPPAVPHLCPNGTFNPLGTATSAATCEPLAPFAHPPRWAPAPSSNRGVPGQLVATDWLRTGLAGFALCRSRDWSWEDQTRPVDLAGVADVLRLYVNDGGGAFTRWSLAEEQVWPWLTVNFTAAPARDGGADALLPTCVVDDVDGDGWDDLLVYEAWVDVGEVRVFFGRGEDGFVTPPERVAVPLSKESRDWPMRWVNKVVVLPDEPLPSLLVLGIPVPTSPRKYASVPVIARQSAPRRFAPVSRFSEHASGLDRPDDAVVGDFTGDGVADLLVRASSSRTLVIMQAPDWTNKDRWIVHNSLAFNRHRSWIQAASLSGMPSSHGLDIVSVWPGLATVQNGRPVSMTPTNGGILVLLNNGQAASFEKYLVQGSEGLEHSVQLVDYDLDGAVDIVCTMMQYKELGSVLVLFRNDGTGHMEPPIKLPELRIRSHILVRDFSNDGLVDIVSVNTPLEYHLSVNSVSGSSFEWLDADHVLSERLVVSDMRSLDIDGDSHLDYVYLVRDKQQNQFRFNRWLYDPNSFLDAVVSCRGNSSGIFSCTHQKFPAQDGDGCGKHPYQFYIADVDRDGRPDIVMSMKPCYRSTRSNLIELGWLRNLGGSRGFAAPVILDKLFDRKYLVSKLVTADFDNDGFEDMLVATNGGGYYRTLLNRETSTRYGPFPSSTGKVARISPACTLPMRVFAAEIDGDGRTDVLIYCNGMIVWAKNTPDGKDGVRMVSGENSVVVRFPRWGEGQFFDTGSGTAGAEVGTSNSLAALADFDGSGSTDVALFCSNGSIVWVANSGDGTFAPLQGRSFIGSHEAYLTSMSAVDMDGDTDIDLLVMASGPGIILFFENDGSGLFSLHSATSVAPDTLAFLEVGDFVKTVPGSDQLSSVGRPDLVVVAGQVDQESVSRSPVFRVMHAVGQIPVWRPCVVDVSLGEHLTKPAFGGHPVVLRLDTGSQPIELQRPLHLIAMRRSVVVLTPKDGASITCKTGANATCLGVRVPANANRLDLAGPLTVACSESGPRHRSCAELHASDRSAGDVSATLFTVPSPCKATLPSGHVIPAPCPVFGKRPVVTAPRYMVVVKDASSSVDGAALRVYGGDVNLQSISLSTGTTQARGGALAILSGSVSIDASVSFWRNSAQLGGNAVFVYGASSSVRASGLRIKRPTTDNGGSDVALVGTGAALSTVAHPPSGLRMSCDFARLQLSECSGSTASVVSSLSRSQVELDATCSSQYARNSTCRLGVVFTTPNAAVCSKCPPGRFQATVDVEDPLAGDCLDCPVNTFSEFGAVECTPCAPGSSTQGDTGYVACVPCAAGRFRSLAHPACEPCELGSFQSDQGQSSCRPSDQGYFVAAAGATFQQPCAAGTKGSKPGASSCTPCPVGQYQVRAGQSVCQVCRRGFTTNSTGSVSCTACAPGQFGDENGRCEPCPAGEFQPGFGATACRSAQPGHFVRSSGSPAEEPCPIGQFVAEPRASSCRLCDKGTFSPRPNATACMDAPEGHYVSQRGAPAPQPCPAGTFSPAKRAGECTKCPIGEFQPLSGRTACKKCPSGTTSNSTGAVSCSPCAPGQYLTGDSACEACQPGTYQPSARATDCIHASAGSFVQFAGSSTQQPCPAGTFSPAKRAEKCTKCSVGEFQPDSGRTSCEPASPGAFVRVSGSTASELCPAGTFSNTSGLSRCSVCAPGTFANETGSVRCIRCGPGYSSSALGAVSCVACSPGRFQKRSESGDAATCERCEPGRYQDLDAQLACKPAPVGSFVRLAGSTGFEQCPSGQYMDKAGRSRCDECAVGKYQDATGAVSCAKCPTGSSTNTTGSARCTPCPPGQYQSQADLHCRQCAAGRYQPRTSQTDCVDAVAGHTVRFDGATQQEPCGPGTYSPGARSTRCIKCAEGSFNPSEGQSACKPCEAGKFASFAGSSDCVMCPAGTASNRSGVAECERCPPGRMSSGRGELNCSVCTAGTYTSEPGSQFCIPCGLGKFQAEHGRRSCELCPVLTVANTSGLSSCFECKPPSFTRGSGEDRCSVCKLGDFPNFNTSDPLGTPREQRRFLGCRVCPDNARCDHESGLVVAERDHWVDWDPRRGKPLVYECRQLSCEKGGCTEGRKKASENPVCAYCEEGLHEWGLDCVKCDSVRWGLLVLMLVLVLIVTAVFHVLSQRTTGELKIALYFVQTVYLFVGPDAGFVVYTTSLLQFSFSDAAGNSCLMPMSALDNVLFNLAGPLVAYTWWLVLVGVAYVRHRVRTKSAPGQSLLADTSGSQHEPLFMRPQMDDDAASVASLDSVAKSYVDGSRDEDMVGSFDMRPYWRTLIGLFLATYNIIISTCFEYFDCETVTLHGEPLHRLRAYPGVSCDDPRYKRWLPVFAGLTVFEIVLVPGAFLLKLLHARGRGVLHSSSFTRLWGVLHSVFTPRFFWWQIYSTSRRTVMTFLFVQWDSVEDRVRKFSVASMLNVLFLVLQITLRPFRLAQENVVESVSLALQCVLTLTLPMMSEPFGDTENTIILCLSVVPGVLVIGWALFHKVKRLVPRVRGVCAKLQGWCASRPEKAAGSDAAAYSEL